MSCPFILLWKIPLNYVTPCANEPAKQQQCSTVHTHTTLHYTTHTQTQTHTHTHTHYTTVHTHRHTTHHTDTDRHRHRHTQLTRNMVTSARKTSTKFNLIIITSTTVHSIVHYTMIVPIRTHPPYLHKACQLGCKESLQTLIINTQHLATVFACYTSLSHVKAKSNQVTN